jgi:hypothetical protein
LSVVGGQFSAVSCTSLDEANADDQGLDALRPSTDNRQPTTDNNVRSVRYPIRMNDEPKKTVSDSLNDWGIDVDRFKERAKESIDAARGDLSEITGTLRSALVQAKDVVLGLQTNGGPAAAELKTGFERAWHEIEAAFKAAREKAKATAPSEPPSEPPAEPPTA